MSTITSTSSQYCDADEVEITKNVKLRTRIETFLLKIQQKVFNSK